MTYYLVLIVAWTCPGGWFGGFIPAKARPLICEYRPEAIFFDRQDRARARAIKEGPGSRLLSCKGFRCIDSLTWKQIPQFSEEKP